MSYYLIYKWQSLCKSKLILMLSIETGSYKKLSTTSLVFLKINKVRQGTIIQSILKSAKITLLLFLKITNKLIKEKIYQAWRIMNKV